MKRQSVWPLIVGLLAVYLLAALAEPCDNAPDCRPRTAQHR